VLDQLGIKLPIENESPTVFVAALGDAARPVAVQLLHTLRRAGVAADMDYNGRSLKSQMRQADKLGAQYVCLIGDDEVAQNVASVKDMTGGSEQKTVPLAELPALFAKETGLNE
jgi:histidyl-tRNA synthetase